MSYYEEKIIDGFLHYRQSPDDEFQRHTFKQLIDRSLLMGKQAKSSLFAPMASFDWFFRATEESAPAGHLHISMIDNEEPTVTPVSSVAEAEATVRMIANIRIISNFMKEADAAPAKLIADEVIAMASEIRHNV